MNRYQFLRILERCRYGLIVLLFQVPAWLMLGSILVKAIRIYLGNPDEFGIIYVQGIQDFSNNMPLPFSIWLIVYLVLQLFLKESLLSIKGQYLTHITHLFLIQWKACDSEMEHHYKRKGESRI